MSVSEARAALLDLLQHVGDGEEVTITRHGRPVAVVVRPDRLRARRSGAAAAEAHRLHQILDEARSSPRVGGTPTERADELVDELRAGRDDHR